MQPKKISARRGARQLALQGLYAWEMTGNNLNLIQADLLSGQYCLLLDTESPDIYSENEQYSVASKFLDQAYFSELLHKIPAHKAEVDALFIPFMSRELEKLGPIEYAILRIASYELKFRPEIPFKVVINEAIDLTKAFGGQDSHKFVNGVLDKIAVNLKSMAS
jgi:N utilization substance protein B